VKYGVELGDGRIGWEGSLREMFLSLDEFRLNDKGNVVSRRLGHETSEAAWDANPLVVRAPELQGIYPIGHLFA